MVGYVVFVLVCVLVALVIGMAIGQHMAGGPVYLQDNRPPAERVIDEWRREYAVDRTAWRPQPPPRITGELEAQLARYRSENLQLHLVIAHLVWRSPWLQRRTVQ